MSTATAGNAPVISMVNSHPLPSFQSLVRAVESRERNDLVEKRQSQGLPYDDETINTVLQELDDNARKRAESLYAYMEKTQRQAPVISQLEYHFVPSEYTALLSAAAANPPVPKDSSEYQQIEFITVNPQDFDDDFDDDDSDDDNMDGNYDVDHGVSADAVSDLEEGEGGHMNAGYEGDLGSPWRDGGLSGSDGIQMEATIDPTNGSNFSHRKQENGRLSQDDIDALCSRLLNFLIMSAVTMWNLPSCRNGCNTVNYRLHFRILWNSLKLAPRESRFREFLAQSMLGCDPHQTITQVRDTLPYLRRDVERIEIPFVPVNTAPGLAGISFLDILYKGAWVMQDHCVTPPQLNSDSETMILSMPAHGTIHSYKMKYRCVSGAMSYYDLAVFVVRFVQLSLMRKKVMMVFGTDRRLYPILSLTHGRLVSLCSVDGVYWWPIFSVTAVDPRTGVPIPSFPY